MNDSLGDRMKRYESAETERRFMSLLPIYARIDGRSFSKFTRGLDRPYDARMSQCMIETTRFLVQHTNATVGYTQSDEISLVWRNDNILSEMLFDGKIFKFTSLLSALATVAFNKEVGIRLPDRTDRIPTFDARVFQVPNLTEAMNAVLWRVNDAVKNSISMAASAHYSHSQLMNINSIGKHDLLYAKGINWNDYPQFFKEGTFLKRVKKTVQLNVNELPLLIKSEALQHMIDNGVTRTFTEEMNWPPFKYIINKVDVLFSDANPILETHETTPPHRESI